MIASLEILEAALDGFNAMFKPGDQLHVRGGKRRDDPSMPTGPLLKLMDKEDHSPASPRVLAGPAFIRDGRVWVMLHKGRGEPEAVPCHRLVWPSAKKRGRP
jgi:hypothetical protein